MNILRQQPPDPRGILGENCGLQLRLNSRISQNLFQFKLCRITQLTVYAYPFKNIDHIGHGLSPDCW